MPDPTPISPPAANYWTELRLPLVSLVFITPMMLIYEAGVWKLGVENGAAEWMVKLLSLMDFRLHLFLPLVTAAILLGWHHLTHHPWRISAGVLSTMAVESLLLAVCLRIALRMALMLQSRIMLQIPAGQPPTLSLADSVRAAVTYLGAGIYEELIFRLMLISGIAWLIRLWWPNQRRGTVIAVLTSSVLFAAAHYIGAAGDPFGWFSFSFRLIAGLFFAVLFIYRGFGITAGAHLRCTIFRW